VRPLTFTTSVSFTYRFLHRIGDAIGIEDHFTIDVTRRAANRLDERAFRAQEALFIGI
jgi:hypothetical protein